MSDATYRTFRSLSDLLDQLPGVDKLVSLRKQVNIKVKNKLGVVVNKVSRQVFMNADLVLAFMFEIQLQTFPNFEWPDIILVKFSVDGRPNQGRDEVLIGIVPMNISLAAQSAYSVFPLAVLECKESEASSSVQGYASKVMSWRSKSFNFGAKSCRVKPLMCSDLVSTWDATGLKYKPNKLPDMPFCPCCLKLAKDINSYELEPTRDLLPNLGFPARDWVYCSLHAGMRITEHMISITLFKKKKAQVQKWADADEIKKHRILVIKKKQRVSMQGGTVKAMLVSKDEDDEESSTNAEDQETKINIKKLDQLLGSTVPATKLMDFIVKSLYGNINHGDHIKLWNCWAVVFTLISVPRDLERDEVQLLEKSINEMKRIWADVHIDRMTPYTHILFFHTMDMVKEHKSIGKYSQQGFEKGNSLHRLIEQRASNHRGGRGDSPVVEQLVNHFYGRYILAQELGLTVEIKKLWCRKLPQNLVELTANSIRTIAVDNSAVPDADIDYGEQWLTEINNMEVELEDEQPAVIFSSTNSNASSKRVVVQASEPATTPKIWSSINLNQAAPTVDQFLISNNNNVIIL